MKTKKPVGLDVVASKPELKAIVTALNLRRKPFDYKSPGAKATLRYGSLVMMVDQDTDGAHIAGLIISFLKWYNPSILEIGFLKQFITPVIKAKRGKQEKSFFSMQTFDAWAKTMSPEELDKYTTMYYKGLGTSKAQEAKEYFSDLSRHLIPFEPLDEEASRKIDVAFSGARIADRKLWIEEHGGMATREPDFVSRPRKFG